MPHDYDVLIIGGGLVGSTLACALSQQDLRIGLVEAHPFQSARQPSYDDRSIALSYGSRCIFEAIGLWSKLAPAATAIHKIHISDQGHFGFSHLDCRDSGHEALGYVIENKAIGNVFSEALTHQSNIDLLCPAELLSLTSDAQQVQVTIKHHAERRQLSARLVIGADGGQSTVRRLCQIDTHRWDYGQSAIIANISPQRPQHNMAYERFTTSGPLALLPLSDQRYSLVWTVRNAAVDELLNLNESMFLNRLQQTFGHRLGILEKCGRRHSYPLQLIRAKSPITNRVVLIGNAAHTLHPIAGQGFNLGMRDVAALAQVISDARQQHQDIGAGAALQQYARWRHQDQRHVSTLTDTLVRVFSNNIPPIVMARNAALLAIDLLPSLKRRVARHAMGLAGRLPRLARGLPL